MKPPPLPGGGERWLPLIVTGYRRIVSLLCEVSWARSRVCWGVVAYITASRYNILEWCCGSRESSLGG